MTSEIACQGGIVGGKVPASRQGIWRVITAEYGIMEPLRILAWPLWWYVRFARRHNFRVATHVRVLPFGGGVGTYFVAKFICGGEWLFWLDWDAMVQGASLGIIGYAFSMATLEVIIMAGWLVFEHIANTHDRIRNEERMAIVTDLLAAGVDREIVRQVAEKGRVELPSPSSSATARTGQG